MDILNKINSSDDIKRLDQSELEPLCDELRRYIIKNVSHTGGHLASNLGSVELTVALHRVYDSSRDRIVFDVGHQSYSHKIITGRRDMFNTLRCHGGISGFPKPYEADDDAFVAGHASDSVSVALGMAHARTLKKQNYDVVVENIDTVIRKYKAGFKNGTWYIDNYIEAIDKAVTNLRTILDNISRYAV